MFRDFVQSTMRLHGDGCLAAFWLYADESGIHDGAAYCLVCGYVGREDHWLRFDQRWREVLADAGQSDFHAKRFFARSANGARVPPYQGFSDREATAFVEALIGTVVAPEHHLNRIGIGIDTAAFSSLSTGERRYLTGGNFHHGRFRLNTGAPTKPYYLAFFHTYLQALRGLPQDNSVMHFMFDQQNVLQEQALAAMRIATDALKARNTPEWWLNQIGPISFAERKKYSALQAADLATYLWYCYAESRAKGVPVSGERGSALKLLASRDHQLPIYGRDEMADDLAKLPDSVRDRIRAQV
jgi:hypothetical protein